MIDRSLLEDIDELSLYVHVPFCPVKCDYCDFYSIESDKSLVDSYFSVLKRELLSLVDIYPKKFKTIYFGGGNPIEFGESRLLELLDISETRGKSEELTVEINPRDFIKDSFDRVIERLDRVSIGFESFDEEVLRTIGRRGSAKDAISALDKAKEIKERISADLMVSIPIDNSLEKSTLDLERVIKSDIPHISMYSLTLYEETPLYRRLKPLSDDRENYILSSLWNILRDSGYFHYEVSNFAKTQDKESIHNKVYWALGSFIGLGPSAESSLGYKNIVSMRNQETLQSYIESPVFNMERLTDEEALTEYIMLSLRTSYGLKKSTVESRFGYSFDKLSNAIESKYPKYIYNLSPDTLSLTDRGLMILDSIVLDLVSSI